MTVLLAGLTEGSGGWLVGPAPARSSCGERRMHRPRCVCACELRVEGAGRRWWGCNHRSHGCRRGRYGRASLSFFRARRLGVRGAHARSGGRAANTTCRHHHRHHPHHPHHPPHQYCQPRMARRAARAARRPRDGGAAAGGVPRSVHGPRGQRRWWGARERRRAHPGHRHLTPCTTLVGEGCGVGCVGVENIGRQEGEKGVKEKGAGG